MAVDWTDAVVIHQHQGKNVQRLGDGKIRQQRQEKKMQLQTDMTAVPR